MAKAAEWINRALAPLGIRIERARPRGWPVADRAAAAKTLIDVGCAFGTPELYALNERARLFLVDPVAEYVPAIERILARRAGGYAITALGAKEGELELDVNLDAPTRSSALARAELTRTGGRIERRRLPVTTLDALVESRDLEPPFVLKIDTEGYELEVLRGAARTLAETELVITETSVLERFEGGYGLFDLVQHLDRAGFRLHRVLTALRDRAGLIRFLDLAFVPKQR